MSKLTLQALLDEVTREDGNLTELLASHQDTDLSGLLTELISSATLITELESPTETDVQSLETLVRVKEELDAEIDKRNEARAQMSARMSESLSKIVPPAPETPAETPVPETSAETPAPETSAETLAPETPVVPDVSEVPSVETVTAANQVRRLPAVNLKELAARAPKAQPPQEKSALQCLTASADVLPEFPTGTPYGNLYQVSQALTRRWMGFSPKTGPPRPGAMAVHGGVAMLTRPESKYQVHNHEDDIEVMNQAADERRLPGGSLIESQRQSGGSLTASLGWCSPSEVFYELCDPGLSIDGLLDLPQVQATRGGVQWTTGPDFCDVFTQDAFWNLTEAQVEAETQKPCFEVPCPEFQECRLSVLGFCLQGGLLNARSYPEMISDWLRKTIIAFAHYRNAYIIGQIVNQSVNLGPQGACGAGLGGGATGSILGAVELQVLAYREQNRLPMGTTLELVAPHWVSGIIRSDLAQRTGVDLLNVSDEMIRSWFAMRGVMLRYVYDWQPLNTACDTSPVDWPGIVRFLLYRAGTWVEAVSPVITIDARYDAALTEFNQYGIRFTEDGICVIQRCGPSYTFSVEVCPNGVTTLGQDPCSCES